MGGTILLDEIGEVSPATQTKLLRVLDTSTFRHVGSTREIRVDVRILTATNRDVPSMVRQGLFRQDLLPSQYDHRGSSASARPGIRRGPTSAQTRLPGTGVLVRRLPVDIATQLHLQW